MILVLSTYPDRASAKRAAKGIVEDGLGACVSIIKIESSVYRWKGRIEEGPEYLLLIKTARKAYPALETRIKRTHPHEVPEIVYFEAKGGLEDYLAWVGGSSSPSARIVPDDLSARRRASGPSSVARRARKPRTLSR